MHATVVVFPGTNADAEMVRTLRDVCGAATTTIRADETSLPSGTDLVALPGGYSYGDYLRSGAIAKVCPIMDAVVRHAGRGGYVIGVCNGFQILTECGLLEGALTPNAHMRFECSMRHVVAVAEGPFSPEPGRVYRLPVAHGEGRYHADAELLRRLEGEGLVGFRYSDAEGAVSPESNFNGSVGSIAGVYGGKAKNVLGLMPHPERMSEPLHGGTDGRLLFDAVLLPKAS